MTALPASRFRELVESGRTEVPHYMDTSALVKLVVAEPETDALRAWLGETDRGPVSYGLARTELMRAVRRTTPDRLLQARAVLDARCRRPHITHRPADDRTLSVHTLSTPLDHFPQFVDRLGVVT